MTRVWLAGWEWECCGDAFAVGDEVDFGIETRTPNPALADLFRPELFATVNATESHHEENFTDRVRGRVTSVYSVTNDVIERRSLRRPGHGAPPDAIMPADGGEWSTIRRELGNGVSVGSNPSRYVVEVVSVPHSAVLTPVPGVRLAVPDQVERVPSAAELAADPPPERRRRSHVGWIVDIEEV